MIIDDDYGVFTYKLYDVNDWRYDICWGYDKSLSTKETDQVDIDVMRRMSWYLYADIPCHILIISTLMDIYRLLV